MGQEGKKYVAIIGDLVGSRALEAKERAQVQEKFQTVLEKVNSDFANEIASLFLITLGDETQGLLKRPDRCYHVLRQIQIGLAPTEIVFGVGYGPLTTQIKEFAVGADGPAFHLARQALMDAKKQRKAYGKSILRDVLWYSNAPLRDNLINALFLSLSVLRSTWTVKQAKVLQLLEQGMNPTDVAAELQTPLSNVSRTIENAHFRESEILIQTVQGLFEEYFEGLARSSKLSKK